MVWRETPEKVDRGALLAVDGHFLCLGEHGHLLWLDLRPKGYREISRASLFLAPETWGLPVLSRGLLYVTQNAQDVQTRARPRPALLRPARLRHEQQQQHDHFRKSRQTSVFSFRT